MGWSVGYDDKHKRDIGYGVPAICEHPDCNEEIDRGLAHVCGGEPYGGEYGCGLFFCASHLYYKEVDGNIVQVCDQCLHDLPEYEPKPDVDEWIEWKMNDESWAKWREENPEFVELHKDKIK